MSLFDTTYRTAKTGQRAGNLFSPRLVRLLKELLADYKKSGAPSELFSAPLDLFYKHRYDLIDSPWDPVIQYRDYQGVHQSFPVVNLGRSFLNQHDSLLLVGNPGVGKSWVLSQLAQQLAEQLLNASTYKVPVILNLERWEVDRVPFLEWGVAQIVESYSIERSLARSFFDLNIFIVLLDNFDRLPLPSRERCVEILNRMHQKKTGTRFILSTRIHLYKQMGKLLEFVDAVEILNISGSAQQQIPSKIKDLAFRDVLQKYDEIRKLLVTPLAVELMDKAYLETKDLAVDRQEEYSKLLADRFLSLL